MQPKPRRQFSFLAKFSLAAFIITAAIAVLLAWGTQRRLEHNALLQAAENAGDQVSTVLNPNLTTADLVAPLSSARFEEIDALIRQNILRKNIVRVKIWNRRGLLLYSDQKNLVGRTFPLSEELQEALEGKVGMEVSSLEKEENIEERGHFKQLLEVYVALRPHNSSEILGAYEIYQDMTLLEPRIATIRRFVWYSVSLGFLILYGSLFMLVYNASRELVRRNQENARLYAEAERRLENLQGLRNIDQAITSSLDLYLTLQVVLTQITTQLGVDAAAVLLLKPHSHALEFAAGRGFRSPAIESSQALLGESYAGRAALERRLLHISNLPAAAHEFTRQSLLAGEQFIAYYVIPLIAKKRVMGVMEIYHRSPLNPQQEWLDFLEALATQTAIAIDNASLFEDLQRSNTDLTLAYDATIEGWSRALDLRDKETEGHTQRVTAMTLDLARAMRIREPDMVHFRRGALLHDIGKMGIPDNILLKPGPLTEEEWKIMRQHPAYAYEMLSPITFLHPALDIPHYHHERWDGSGYPHALKGEQIPLAARIFAVADVWDALSSNRPYRPAWPADKIWAYLQEQTGRLFDPQVVKLFKTIRGQNH
jgi:putative nucleotidyltransferase with HDIG domain